MEAKEILNALQSDFDHFAREEGYNVPEVEHTLEGEDLEPYDDDFAAIDEMFFGDLERENDLRDGVLGDMQSQELDEDLIEERMKEHDIDLFKRMIDKYNGVINGYIEKNSSTEYLSNIARLCRKMILATGLLPDDANPFSNFLRYFGVMKGTEDMYDVNHIFQMVARGDKNKDPDSTTHAYQAGSSMAGSSRLPFPIPNELLTDTDIEIERDGVKTMGTASHLLKKKKKQSEQLTIKGLIFLFCQNIHARERSKDPAIRARRLYQEPLVKKGSVNVHGMLIKYLTNGTDDFSPNENIIFDKVREYIPDFTIMSVEAQTNAMGKLLQPKARFYLTRNGKLSQFEMRETWHLVSRNEQIDIVVPRAAVEGNIPDRVIAERRDAVEYIYKLFHENGKTTDEFIATVESNQLVVRPDAPSDTIKPTGPGMNLYNIVRTSHGYFGRVATTGVIMIFENMDANPVDTFLKIKFINGFKQYKKIVTVMREKIKIMCDNGGFAEIEIQRGKIMAGTIYADNEETANDTYRLVRIQLMDINEKENAMNHQTIQISEKAWLIKNLKFNVHSPSADRERGPGFLNGLANIFVNNDPIKWVKRHVYPAVPCEIMYYDSYLGIIPARLSKDLEGELVQYHVSPPLNVERPIFHLAGMYETENQGIAAFFDELRLSITTWGISFFKDIWVNARYGSPALAKFQRFYSGSQFQRESTRALVYGMNRTNLLRFSSFLEFLPVVYGDTAPRTTPANDLDNVPYTFGTFSMPSPDFGVTESGKDSIEVFLRTKGTAKTWRKSFAYVVPRIGKEGLIEYKEVAQTEANTSYGAASVLRTVGDQLARKLVTARLQERVDRFSAESEEISRGKRLKSIAKKRPEKKRDPIAFDKRYVDTKLVGFAEKYKEEQKQRQELIKPKIVKLPSDQQTGLMIRNAAVTDPLSMNRQVNVYSKDRTRDEEEELGSKLAKLAKRNIYEDGENYAKKFEKKERVLDSDPIALDERLSEREATLKRRLAVFKQKSLKNSDVGYRRKIMRSVKKFTGIQNKRKAIARIKEQRERELAKKAMDESVTRNISLKARLGRIVGLKRKAKDKD